MIPRDLAPQFRRRSPVHAVSNWKQVPVRLVIVDGRLVVQPLVACSRQLGDRAFTSTGAHTITGE